jgi:hypothetical protein
VPKFDVEAFQVIEDGLMTRRCDQIGDVLVRLTNELDLMCAGVHLDVEFRDNAALDKELM